MAKKGNRAKTKRATPPRRSAVETTTSTPDLPPPPAESQAPDASAPRAIRTPKLTRSQAASERLEDEYSYIVDDLRRVFILAAAMFALLIVLNLVFDRFF